ncbi:hypothetical protein FA15DRAFT_701303 [Coprinopsis marcescibilis]|uniref:Uncharacterized protein n=1 Tax=Coprinopsis marcescibilis TaxID=230819 RepID=A0A5C3L604_COPMA|nr:hypothetical protein FA15DRAFT_701303 [Coprinopsis marcescibilis]
MQRVYGQQSLLSTSSGSSKTRSLVELGSSVDLRQSATLANLQSLLRASQHRKSSSDLKLVISLYLQVRNICDNEVHLAFFRVTLERPSRHLVPVVHLLCDLLEHRAEVPQDYANMFWRALLELGTEPDPALQERVLKFVSYRTAAFQLRVGHNTRQAQQAREEGLNSNDLKVLLASTVFSNVYPSSQSVSCIGWISQQSLQAFDSRLSTSTRWENLLLLAMTMTSDNRVQHIEVAPVNSCTQSQTFRFVLFVSFLRATLWELNVSANDTSSLTSGLQAVANQLWQTWQESSELSQPPLGVQRAVLSALLSIAGWILDEKLLHAVFRWGRKHSLWSWSENASPSAQSQILHVISVYFASLAKCRDYNWGYIFPYLQSILAGGPPMPTSMSSVLKSLIPWGVEHAYDFHTFIAAHQIYALPETSVLLGARLAHNETWDSALNFLSDKRLTTAQWETLLVSILRVFQTRRLEKVDPQVIGRVAQAIDQLYNSSPPPSSVKYPIRYFLNLMIAAQHGSSAVDTIALIYKHDPQFFTQRCIRRYARSLVRHQNAKDALRLFQFSRKHFTGPGVADLSRKLSAKLVSSDMLGVAIKVPVNEGRWRTQKERMLRVSLSRTRTPRKATLQVMTLMKKADKTRPSYPATMRFAVSFLVKHKRLYAARKLYGRVRADMDGKTRTILGNIIIHGCIRKGRCNARLLRHIHKTRDVLSTEYGFISDCATVNIIVKGILMGQKRMETIHVRALFDELVHRGYPVPQKFLLQHDTPFGNPPSSSVWAPTIPVVPRPTSFRKHIQPLYKMFIKALHRHRDVAGAQTVVGILQEERYLATKETEKRNKARREGITRKRAKQASPK